ncbi:Dbl homology domain-containing protein [Mycena latifolia]|nr:Dbl homology domain-containing protein [Mycena latifolia]
MQQPGGCALPACLGAMYMSAHQPSPIWLEAQEQRAQDSRRNIISELVETERKYVQDLEILQKYATALSHNKSLDQETLDLLFGNVWPLPEFQRKFLVGLEGTAELPWEEQRWGRHFVHAEQDFIRVYEPYCANYTNSSDISHLVREHEQHLTVFNHLIALNSELPAFLVKPVSRVCKYSLLLESLLKASSAATYAHYDELKSGLAASTADGKSRRAGGRRVRFRRGRVGGVGGLLYERALTMFPADQGIQAQAWESIFCDGCGVHDGHGSGCCTSRSRRYLLRRATGLITNPGSSKRKSIRYDGTNYEAPLVLAKELGYVRDLLVVGPVTWSDLNGEDREAYSADEMTPPPLALLLPRQFCSTLEGHEELALEVEEHWDLGEEEIECRLIKRLTLGQGRSISLRENQRVERRDFTFRDVARTCARSGRVHERSLCGVRRRAPPPSPYQQALRARTDGRTYLGRYRG